MNKTAVVCALILICVMPMACGGGSDGDWTIAGNDMYSAVSGNVGVGTTSPVAKMDIAGDASDPVLSVVRTGGHVTNPIVSFRNVSPPIDAMTILGNGHVGLRKTNPGFLLDVNGPILVRRGGSNGGIKTGTPCSGGCLSFQYDVVERVGLIGTYGQIPNHNTALAFGTNASTLIIEHMRITYGGLVGIGTRTPNYKLDVRGSIGNNATLLHSDIRWKTKVETLKGSLEKVQKLRGVQFEWRTDQFEEMNFQEGKHIGVIAQEVEQVIPELVTTGADGYKSVEYTKLVAVLVEAMKEQQQIMAKQEATIEDLVARVSVLEKKENKMASMHQTSPLTNNALDKKGR